MHLVLIPVCVHGGLQKELLGVLYPMFVHTFLEMVEKGHGEQGE